MFAASAPALAQVEVTVNGSEVDFASAPIIQAGRVFVPLRGVFERLRATVDYASGTINATSSAGQDISLQIGSTRASINGQSETVDVAPFIVGDTTFVPLRFIAQALGAQVAWDESSRLVSISLENTPQTSGYVAPASDTDITEAPPPLPAYEVPPVPAPNEVWQPGYWARGAYGYFWVPGTWVAAPEAGYLWTPGYWAWHQARYGWHPGYWAHSIGFYGGVNYGDGYFGHGFVGGFWRANRFFYNTAVTHVTNITIIKNVYIDRTVIAQAPSTRICYNGGPTGISARPTFAEIAVAHTSHIGLTLEQRQHVLVASRDRRFLATVNHSSPPVLAAPRPLQVRSVPAAIVPVRESDRVETRIEPLRKPAPTAAHAAYFSKPGFAPVRPTYVAPKALATTAPQPYVTPKRYVFSKPAYVAPKPADTTSNPTYVTPKRMFVTPKPAYIAPKPAYVAPKPAYIPDGASHAADSRTLSPFVRPVPPIRTVHPAAKTYAPSVRPTKMDAVPTPKAPALHRASSLHRSEHE